MKLRGPDVVFVFFCVMIAMIPWLWLVFSVDFFVMEIWLAALFTGIIMLTALMLIQDETGYDDYCLSERVHYIPDKWKRKHRYRRV